MRREVAVGALGPIEITRELELLFIEHNGAIQSTLLTLQLEVELKVVDLAYVIARNGTALGVNRAKDEGLT